MRRAAECDPRPTGAVEAMTLRPAIIVTAECDVLHDEGKGYADALRRAGIAVEYREYPGMIHAFFGMVPAVDDAMNAQRAVAAAFGRAFSPT